MYLERVLFEDCDELDFVEEAAFAFLKSLQEISAKFFPKIEIFSVLPTDNLITIIVVFQWFPGFDNKFLGQVLVICMDYFIARDTSSITVYSKSKTELKKRLKITSDSEIVALKIYKWWNVSVCFVWKLKSILYFWTGKALFPLISREWSSSFY